MNYAQEQFFRTIIDNDMNYPLFIQFSGTGKDTNRVSITALQAREIMLALGRNVCPLSVEEEKSIIENIKPVYGEIESEMKIEVSNEELFLIEQALLTLKNHFYEKTQISNASGCNTRYIKRNQDSVYGCDKLLQKLDSFKKRGIQ